jgi:hypothetical protein
MKFYGSKLAEGSSFANLTIASGPTFPEHPSTGEMFVLTTQGEDILYVYLTGGWSKFVPETTANSLKILLVDITTDIAGNYNISPIELSETTPAYITEFCIDPPAPIFNKITSTNPGIVAGTIYRQNSLLAANPDGTITFNPDPYSPLPNYEFTLVIKYF